MHGNTRNGESRRRLWLFGGFLLAAVTIIALVGAYRWQSGLHDSRLDEAESHAAAAALLQEAGQEGQTAAELLQRYVAEGDPALIAEIQGHAAAGVAALTRAIGQGGVAGSGDIAVKGAALADGAGQIVALRQAGDVAGAAAALEAAGPSFRELASALDNSISLELAQAASLRESADSAQSAGSWLLTAAVVLGVATGLAGLTLVARSLVKRRVPATTSPM